MESNEVLGKHGRARARVIRISRSDETRDRFLLAIPRWRPTWRQTPREQTLFLLLCVLRLRSIPFRPFSKRCKLICAWKPFRISNVSCERSSDWTFLFPKSFSKTFVYINKQRWMRKKGEESLITRGQETLLGKSYRSMTPPNNLSWKLSTLLGTIPCWYDIRLHVRYAIVPGQIFAPFHVAWGGGSQR